MEPSLIPYAVLLGAIVLIFILALLRLWLTFLTGNCLGEAF